MGIGAAENFGMSHSRQLDIHGIQSFACDFLFTIDSRFGFANDIESLSFLHPLTSVAVILVDPLYRLLAARKLSAELCFFQLFENFVENWTGAKAHRNQILTAEKRRRMNLFTFQFGQLLLAKLVILEIAIGRQCVNASELQEFVDPFLTEKPL